VVKRVSPRSDDIFNEEKQEVKRQNYSLKEDLMLAKYFREFGMKWKLMVPFFNNRSYAKLKNRYYSYLRKGKIMESLLFILNDLEEVGPIDGYSEESLEPFRQFIAVQ
jgi:hypothetical protein